MTHYLHMSAPKKVKKVKSVRKSTKINRELDESRRFSFLLLVLAFLVLALMALTMNKELRPLGQPTPTPATSSLVPST